jgi:SAM-dependent methyltransferase
MECKGFSVYDQQDFLEAYLARRNRKESPNNAIEKPIVFELLGDYEGAEILDLGSGDGTFGRELLQGGAKSFAGIEASKRMHMQAQAVLSGPESRLYNEDIVDYAYPEAAYDIVTSRFVIHYIADIRALFRQVFKTLKPGGKFVFTIQHPLTTSSFGSKEEGDRRGDWRVDDYFVEGERREPWINNTVVKHHRTAESYFTALMQAGFAVNAFREGRPVRSNFAAQDEYKRRQRIPLMLILSAIKQAE